MYWHRNTNGDTTLELKWNESWPKENDLEINPASRKKNKTDSHTTRVRPVKPGATFQGKIWFQNLSKTELGLMLTALKPPALNNQIFVLKIGLAKPLGLGSIKVDIDKLKIFNLKFDGYYSSFSPNEDQMYLQMKPEEVIEYFDQVCAKKLGLISIWDSPRLKQLIEMMIWDDDNANNDWLTKTRYMEIKRASDGKNEFKNRPILPNPSGVKSISNEKFV